MTSATNKSISGIEAMVELLAGLGVRYVFGNPGTTELPLNDLLVTDQRLQYILGLQEVPVMGMADGYAMASGTIGLVNLHISCGLGNAMGILYNAYREGTPLLVTAGQQDRRLAFDEPILGGDMVSVARPWTKWSVEVSRVEDLPTALRRAVQCALTPPTGPVFLSLPIDVQLERSDKLDLAPIRLPDFRVRPPQAAIAEASRVLLEARNPAILAGSRVCERSAVSELVTVAEILGCPVYSEPGTTHGRLAFPCDHPLYGQGLPLWSPEVLERLAPHDCILVTGMDLMRLYMFHEPSRPLPPNIKIVHLDESSWQLNKNYACDVAILGDTREGLALLASEMRLKQTSAKQEELHARRQRTAAAHQAAREKLEAQIARLEPTTPLSPLAAMAAVARVLPPDIAVVEEAVTTTGTTLERLGAIKNTTGYFGHRGWTLGWGLGVAIGAKLAWPDRPVLAILGEGAALYGIQGLWTAARYQLPVIFLICNNAQYQILKIGARGLGLPQALEGNFEALDIAAPEVDFVSLARSLGVDSMRITSASELSEVLAANWNRRSPLLIDLPIERTTQPRLNYG